MIRPECYLPLKSGWQRPTPAEVAELLQQHGRTAYWVHQHLGVGKATVSRWLSGQHSISYRDWVALRAVVQTSDHP